MLRGISVLIGAALVSGCGFGSDNSGLYVAELPDDNAVMQLSLVEAENGQINATVSISSANYETMKVETDTGGMTGISDDSSIGLLSSKGNGGSMTLQKDGQELVWQNPSTGQSVVFQAASPADYQQKIVQLNMDLDELEALSHEE